MWHFKKDSFETLLCNVKSASFNRWYDVQVGSANDVIDCMDDNDWHLSRSPFVNGQDSLVHAFDPTGVFTGVRYSVLDGRVVLLRDDSIFELSSSDLSGSFVGAIDVRLRLANNGAASLTEPLRCCNYHGCILERKGKSRDASLTRFECPHRGCTVAWWGKSGSSPADSLVRSARRQVFSRYFPADVNMRIKESLNAELIHRLRQLLGDDADYFRLGFANAAECRSILNGECSVKSTIQSDLSVEVRSASGRRRMSIEE